MWETLLYLANCGMEYACHHILLILGSVVVIHLTAAGFELTTRFLCGVGDGAVPHRIPVMYLKGCTLILLGAVWETVLYLKYCGGEHGDATGSTLDPKPSTPNL